MKNKPIDKFKYLPYRRKLTDLARRNRSNPSPAEKKIWYEVLCRKQFKGYKFTRQKPLGGYIVDFYCSKLQLVIEIDGDSHTENKEYDRTRTEVLSQLGLRVLRYTNHDVCNNIEAVYQDLMQIIEPPSPPLSGGHKNKSPEKRDFGGSLLFLTDTFPDGPSGQTDVWSPLPKHDITGESSVANRETPFQWNGCSRNTAGASSRTPNRNRLQRSASACRS
jgi:very-short-patch-repair endonuclease